MQEAIHRERRSRLFAAMQHEGIDVLVVAGNAWRNDYIRYAVDVTPVEGQAIAILGRDAKARLIVESAAEAARIAAEHPEIDISWSTVPAAEAQRILETMAQLRVSLVPADAAPHRLAAGPLGRSVDRATALLDGLLLRKSPVEIEAIRRAAALADEGYRVFMEAARVGRPEYALVADLEAWFRSRGCAENFMILGSGGREVRGMHPPSERRIARGDLVTTELTPCVDGYYAQICRTLVVGPPSQAQLRAFAVFVEALEAGIAAVRPGATAGEVARAENDVFRRHGLGEYVTSEYTRVRGHGMGLYVDSRPHVLEDVDLVLEPDMALIVHPNTYHPEVGYIVLGDAVRVTEEGCEVLCRTPRELFPVPA